MGEPIQPMGVAVILTDTAEVGEKCTTNAWLVAVLVVAQAELLVITTTTTSFSFNVEEV